jgi:ligand-binding sensor domain-containing protein/DNA-binding CsgD family transcriptional regulator
MKLIPKFKKAHSLVYIFFLLTSILYCQVKSIGLPEIRNYKRNDYKGGTQNWNIDQDKNGNIYFANNNGLFQFDGAFWHEYTLPNHSGIRSLKIDASGKIYVGNYNEFGYFKTDPKGKLIYFSLSKFLNKKIVNTIDMVWKIHLYKDEVIFQSFALAYVYKNNKISLLKPKSRFQFSFEANKKLYFQDVSAGLMEYRNGELIALEGTKNLNNTEVWGIIAMPENKILIATIDKGLFLYNNKTMIPWNTEANVYVKNNSCLGGVLIGNNYIALNTVLNGIIICNKEGKIIQHINSEKGLQNNTVLSSFIDNQGNLWLGLDNGITFVNENSAFSYFGYSYDISTVYASVIYKDLLYVATNQGVFYHSRDKPFKEDTFSIVEGTTGQAWNLQIIDNQLICAHNRGALIIEDGKSIKTLDNNGYWNLKKVPNHQNLMIGSNYNGFSLFEKKSNNWQFVKHIEGFNKSVGYFETDDKNIWSKKDELIYQMSFSDDFKKFKSIKTYKHLPKTNKTIGSIQSIKGTIFFQTDNHFYKYSQVEKSFYEDKLLTKLFQNIPKVNFISEDNAGNIWYIFNKSLGVLMKNPAGNYQNIVAPFSNLRENLVYNNLSVNTYNSENIFIGLTDGLAHYDSKLIKNFIKKPKTFIRSFSNLGDTLIYGNEHKITHKYKIPFKSNYIKFTYSSPTYENIENIKFSYQLEGFEDKWSDWTSVSRKEYTNLKEGNYSMKVKTRSSYGIESDPAIVSFTITPPWYRSYLAYLFYLISIGITIFFIRKGVQNKIRKNKYYETIEQRRLYLEKESKIRQEQYELEKEIERLTNDKLKIKILVKDKELVNNSLQVVKKNKILNGIIHKLKDIDIESFDDSAKFQISKLNKSIAKEVNADHSWKDLEKHIKNVHFDFLKRLKEKYPTISPRELDLSTYLLMNMSTKEIAEIMNISNGGVELARYRLRKKLNLNKKENLIGFLMGI